MDPNPDIEAIEVRLVLEAIHARYGYDLRGYSGASIRRRVLAALAKSGLKHLGDLQHALLNDASFFGNILEDLTVRVSEMFRDPSFYRVFRTRVVPVLRTYPLLKIWHSGCASGEEVYASAILLLEEGLLDRSQIYATDLSPQALEQAKKQGTYSAESLPLFRDNYQKGGGQKDFASYYTEAYDGIAMHEQLRRPLSFFHHDLVSDHVFGEMHVVFCRNVLIYFSQDLRHRVIGKFAQSLYPGGFLCLGSSERLSPGGPTEHFAEFDAPERIYRYEG
jgi:chemotaxis protein methyltransferase CheR